MAEVLTRGMSEVEVVYLDGSTETFATGEDIAIQVPVCIIIKLAGGEVVYRMITALRGWTYRPGKLAIARGSQLPPKAGLQ